MSELQCPAGNPAKRSLSDRKFAFKGGRLKFPPGFFQVISKKPISVDGQPGNFLVDIQACPSNEETQNTVPENPPASSVPPKKVKIRLSQLKLSAAASDLTVLKANDPNPCVSNKPEPPNQPPVTKPQAEGDATKLNCAIN